LRRQWVLAGIVLIIGASLLTELVLNRLYPETGIEISLPELRVGEEHVYTFYREGQQVGTHSYVIAGRIGEGASAEYTMISTTDITYEGKSLLLRGEYVFDHLYRPIGYALNASEEDKRSRVRAAFSQGEVEITIDSEGETIELTEQVAEGTLLIENQMPGYWEILLQSSTLMPGKRYVVDAFIPQLGAATRLTLTVDRGTSKVTHEGVELDCKVVREADQGLVFYLYGGQLIQYRDDENGVTMTKDF
jgi:hypothetical protein